MAVIREMLSAVGTMPIFDNRVVNWAKNALANSSLNRTLAATLVTGVTGAYNLYCQYIADGTPFGGFLPALGGAFNAPVMVLGTYMCLEFSKQIVDTVSAFRQNRSQGAIQQTLETRQGALRGEVNGELNVLDQDILNLNHVSLIQELNALRAGLTPLQHNLQGQRTEAQLVQDRQEFEQLKKVHQKIFSVNGRIDAHVPAVLRNRLQTLITGPNQLDAGNHLQNTLQKLELLDQQLELRAKACEKILLLGSVKMISTQKDRLTAIKLRQEAIIPQIANLVAEITQLRTQLGEIQAKEDGWFSSKGSKLAAKRTEINAKEVEITQLRDSLINLRGLSWQDVNGEIARLEYLPQPRTAQITARIQGYKQIRDRLNEIALLAPDSAQAKALKGKIQSSLFLSPQAIQAQIAELDGELQKLPSLGSQELNQITGGLGGVRDALNIAVDPLDFGIQKQAFKALDDRIPNPLQAPAAAAAAVLAPAAAAAQPQPQPAVPAAAAAAVLAPAAAAAAEPPVEFFMPNAADLNGPPISLVGLSPLPNLPLCPLVATKPEATIFDMVIPEKHRPLGGMCFAAALQMVLKVPFFVDQLRVMIDSRINDNPELEQALFGDTGAGGIGDKTQKENPQYPREKLVALKNLAILFRNPTANVHEELRKNLEILERDLDLPVLKGLKPENKQKIRELLLLLQLRQAAIRSGEVMSGENFGKIFDPFFQLYKIATLPNEGPAVISRTMFDLLAGLIAPQSAEVFRLVMAHEYKISAKHKVIQMIVPAGEKPPEEFTARIENTLTNVRYKAVGIVETPLHGKELSATTHTLRQRPGTIPFSTKRSWHSYNSKRAQRVLEEEQMAITAFKNAPGFSPVFAMYVPVE